MYKERFYIEFAVEGSVEVLSPHATEHQINEAKKKQLSWLKAALKNALLHEDKEEAKLLRKRIKELQNDIS